MLPRVWKSALQEEDSRRRLDGLARPGDDHGDDSISTNDESEPEGFTDEYEGGLFEEDTRNERLGLDNDSDAEGGSEQWTPMTWLECLVNASNNTYLSRRYQQDGRPAPALQSARCIHPQACKYAVTLLTVATE